MIVPMAHGARQMLHQVDIACVTLRTHTGTVHTHVTTLAPAQRPHVCVDAVAAVGCTRCRVAQGWDEHLFS